nr:DUF262 domain-containing protein [Corynebacterium sp. 76QC2CO]
MRGNVSNIYKVFDGSDRKLVIPVYQRNYDWTEKQCAKLFDDLTDMIRAGRPAHFFGAVVVNPEDSFTSVVIDGQQRMTTVSLLMLALAHALEEQEIAEVDEGEEKDGLAQKLLNNYLLLQDSGQQKFKLKPVKDDANAYTRLFGPEEYFNEKSKITVNYRYFRERLRRTEFSAQTLWKKGICQLEVMHLDLESHDDPQRIFESLNSTGLALKESDKIRNLVLMGLDHNEQLRVYEQFWNPLEMAVNFQTDRFVRWYLVAKTSKTPREDAVFEEFKRFAEKSSLPYPAIVEEMHRFAVYDKQLSTASTGFADVDRILRRANQVIGDVVKPLLYLTFRDLKEGVISSADFASIVEILESYIFRRFVVSIATNSLNKIFANAYSELRKLRKNQEPYSDILAYMLTTKSKSGRFPDDEEFAAAFAMHDFYSIRRYRPYLFNCLETAGSKDVKDIADYIANEELTIEHIMPQTLNKAWRAELGPDAEKIHRNWLHRIGNLTITGYNSTYSNASFTQKLTMDDGFKDSPYWLNSFLKQQVTWGPEQLERRTNLLVDRALTIWKSPEASFVPEKEILAYEPLGKDANFTGEQLAAIEVEGNKVPVTVWAQGLVEVLRILLTVDRERLLTAAMDEELLFVDDVVQRASIDTRLRVVDPALGVRVTTSTNQKMALLRRVCAAIDYDPEDILFYLRSKEAEKGEDDSGDQTTQSPYEYLRSLAPLLEEFAGSDFAEAETLELQDEFLNRIAPHRVENPSGMLSGKSLEAFLTQHPVDTLTTEEVLACLTTYETMANLLGKSVIHGGIINGTLGQLIERLP